MIGNVIQSKFLVLTDYPAAAALSFVADGGDPRRGSPSTRALGTEKLTG